MQVELTGWTLNPSRLR